MTDKNAELVLCTRTERLPAHWLPEAGAIQITEVELLKNLESIEPHWLPRGQAENDPTFKQWIPYVLLCNREGALAAYPRQGTEARLHGLWSLGIGGHINPVDGKIADALPKNDSWHALLWNGMRRELEEEYPAAVKGETRFLGLIHESQTAVGRVHLGAVFLHAIDIIDADPGAELKGLRWLDQGQIGILDWPLERFELWSQLALDLWRNNCHLPKST